MNLALANISRDGKVVRNYQPFPLFRRICASGLTEVDRSGNRTQTPSLGKTCRWDAPHRTEQTMLVHLYIFVHIHTLILRLRHRSQAVFVIGARLPGDNSPVSEADADLLLALSGFCSEAGSSLRNRGRVDAGAPEGALL